MKHLKTLGLILFLLLTPSLRAQKHSYYMDGFVRDSFTKENIQSAFVTIMTLDSAVVDTFTAKRYGWWQVAENVTLPHPGKYIVKFVKEGYYDAYQEVKFVYVKHRKNGCNLNEVLMRKIPKAKKADVELRAAEVVATKIKMVMKGDTIVYNADAFQLQSGSMLDKLIERLPGVVLHDDGQIYVNGEKVQSLLVNGEDFFRGDPKVALDNLPAYMVDKVKVYNRMPDNLSALGMDPENFNIKSYPLVVDVNLKKQYSIGWVANVTGGYGTDDHYQARLFALRFTPQTRVAFVANSNNVYGDSYYDSDGNWQQPGNAQVLTTHEAGTDLLVKDERERVKLTNNLTFKYRKRESESKTSTTTFLDGDNVYGRQSDIGRYRNWNITDRAKLSYTVVPKRGPYFEFSPNISYGQFSNWNLSRSADFREQLTESYMGAALDSLFTEGSAFHYRRNLISALRTHTQNEGNTLSTDGELTGDFRLNPDILRFKVGGNYYKQNYRTLFHTNDGNLNPQQDRFRDTPYHEYSYYAKVSYGYYLKFQKASLRMTPTYGYSQSYTSSDRDYYQLEGTDAAQWEIEWLASTKDALSQYIDAQNSVYSANLNRTHTAGMDFLVNLDIPKIKHGNFSFAIGLPLRHTADRLSYSRGDLNTVKRNRNLFFEPNFEWRIDNSVPNKYEHHFRLGYKYSSSTPDLSYMLDYEDTATPLVVRLGNPNLKNGHTQAYHITYSRNAHRKQIFFNSGVYYTRWDNSLIQSMTYDAATGVRTYRPDVINGNYNVRGNIGMNFPLDKAKRWTMYMNTSADYRHSVDMAALSGATESVRSTVGRTVFGEELRVVYSENGYRIEPKLNVSWTHSVSDRFSTLNAIGFNYGTSLSIPLPLKFELFTTATMYSRRGYSDERFNTDQFIWNVQLSRSIMEGNLRFQLEAFDLLNKMSSYSYNINAQMQTETYQNVLRRYVMLSVTYRLNRERKNR